LRNVLNAGFQKNGKTARCEQNGLGSFKPKELKLFCPRAIAGIGKDILSPTTRDRTFFVEMICRAGCPGRAFSGVAGVFGDAAG
jgi:hypothetical protein